MKEYRTSLPPVTRQDSVSRFKSPIHLMRYFANGRTGMPAPRAIELPIPKQINKCIIKALMSRVGWGEGGGGSTFIFVLS